MCTSCKDFQHLSCHSGTTVEGLHISLHPAHTSSIGWPPGNTLLQIHCSGPTYLADQAFFLYLMSSLLLFLNWKKNRFHKNDPTYESTNPPHWPLFQSRSATHSLTSFTTPRAYLGLLPLNHGFQAIPLRRRRTLLSSDAASTRLSPAFLPCSIPLLQSKKAPPRLPLLHTTISDYL